MPWQRAWFAAAALLPALHAGPAAGVQLEDLHFGEALYYAYQESYFEALERLDSEIAQHYGVDEPELDSLQAHIDHAEFSVGDFELHYRMHHRAGRAIRAVLEGDVPEPVRNEAAYRLARIHFQKGQPADALKALDGIRGEIPDDVRDDVAFLRANVYLALGRPAEAVELLRELQGSASLRGFSAYNLGIALLRDGREKEALLQLDRAGKVSAGEPATLAIRDKSNLVLGTLLFEAEAYGPAQSSLDRVRLSGPFSNQALLRAGWADASAENFERALVPWSILAERDATDAAVQEAMLALPYAYSKLDVHGRAALLYGHAVEVFGDELAKVDASIGSIREGEFLKALVREEIRRDKDWVIRLRSLPDAPETFYLIALMASHDFQTALQNYLDLEDLRKKLVGWQRSLDAFEELIELRRRYYEPLLPDIDHRFRKLDARMRLRLEQRNHVEERLQHLLVAPRPELLATSEEQRQASRLDRVEAALAGLKSEEAETLRARLARLRGALFWTLETRYHERLTEAHDHLRELNKDVARLKDQYDGYVRTRQAAVHGYEGYERPIAGLRGRVVAALDRLKVLMPQQGRVLETVAIEELQVRRERLETYQNQARFAFADSYDRAAKAQAR
ncbi:MAG: tetratricopeptide repeat protein [Myxococcota bacterium]|nr:tetratricopeptide repeat protein [Myxococcota bacterium]